MLSLKKLARATRSSSASFTTQPLSVGGMVTATRLFDGNTSVKVAMTMKPNTTYRFSLKCVRPLGEIRTDDEGIANVALAFPTDMVGPVYSFEMSVEGAPPGNKYQSAQVKFK